MFLTALTEFLLFAAFVLLLISSISAPIINDVAFLNVRPRNQIYRFGAWGMCQTAGQDRCTGSSLGYNLTDMLAQLSGGGYDFHHSLSSSTKVNILVPIACGISFLAMLVAWMSNKFGFFVASFISSLAFIVSLAAMIAEFVIYGLAKRDANRAGLRADYGSAMWMVLAATIALFLASITALFQCCCGHRQHKNRTVNDHHVHDPAYNQDVHNVHGNHVTHTRRGIFGRRKQEVVV